MGCVCVLRRDGQVFCAPSDWIGKLAPGSQRALDCAIGELLRMYNQRYPLVPRDYSALSSESVEC